VLLISWRKARVCIDCRVVFMWRYAAERFCSDCREVRRQSVGRQPRAKKVDAYADAAAALEANPRCTCASPDPFSDQVPRDEAPELHLGRVCGVRLADGETCQCEGNEALSGR
jgi:hypothetical protein